MERQHTEARNVSMYRTDWSVVESVAQRSGVKISGALRMIVREWARREAGNVEQPAH